MIHLNHSIKLMSTNNRDFIKCLMQSGQRIDGREPLQNRDLKVLFGSGDMGSVEVEYGDSRVLQHIKFLGLHYH